MNESRCKRIKKMCFLKEASQVLVYHTVLIRENPVREFSLHV